MLKSRHIDHIALIAMAVAMVLVMLFMAGESLGLQKLHSAPPYAEFLFGEDKVHTIDIVLNESDWRRILENPRAKEYVPASFIVGNEHFSGAGLRIKGSNSLTQTLKYGSERFSLKVEFDHFIAGKTFLGLDKISLNASFQDNSFLKEAMTYDMMRHIGVPSPLTSYAYLRINGEDWGLFVVIEEIEEAFIRRNYGPMRGMLYKPEYRRLSDENNDVALIYTGEDFALYDNIFRKSRFNASDADKQRLIESLRKLSLGEDLESIVEIDLLLKYFAVQNFVVNLDSYLGHTGHNYYLREIEGKLTMLPWDFNLAYGTYLLGMSRPIEDPNYAVNLPILTPSKRTILERRPLYDNILRVEEYRERYEQIYSDFVKTYIESGYFQQRVERLTEMISPYVEKDPTKFVSHEDFLLAVDVFTEFNLLRSQSVRGQLEGNIPKTLRGMGEALDKRIDATHIRIEDLGDFDDMRNLIDGRLPQ